MSERITELDAFKNRVIKNHKHLSKWAKREGIEAYRLYDCDIPQFPVAIDCYGARLHVAEYDKAWQQTEEEHQLWIGEIKQVLSTYFQIEPADIAYKWRKRQKGLEQYEKLGQQGEPFVVHEYGRRFWVNLDNYLDTGLFLDHRPTRKKVGEMSKAKRVLNLFAYTGSFSVYAATGGAAETVTVDLSNTYLQWSQRNFALNGMDQERHTIVRADVLLYLEEAQQQRERFDIIVMDPPSFSNSAKMWDTLDVQRDHGLLIDGCMALLNPGGVLFFSTNRRNFILDEEFRAQAKNNGLSSIPEDFRNKKIHQCFEFWK